MNIFFTEKRNIYQNHNSFRNIILILTFFLNYCQKYPKTSCVSCRYSVVEEKGHKQMSRGSGGGGKVEIKCEDMSQNEASIWRRESNTITEK